MTVNEYLEMSYTIEMIRKKTGFNEITYYTSVKEIPGCWSEGATPNSAWFKTMEAMRLWIETALERGLEIPLPKKE